MLHSISHGFSQQSIPSLQPQWARVRGKSLQVTMSWSLDQKLVIASQQLEWLGEGICDFSFSAKTRNGVAREEFPPPRRARGSESLRNRESKRSGRHEGVRWRKISRILAIDWLTNVSVSVIGSLSN